MQCPRCGFEQPEGVECVSCGVVFDRSIATAEEETAAEADSAFDLDEEDASSVEVPPAPLAESPPVSEEPPPPGEPAISRTAPRLPTRPGLFRRDNRADQPIGAAAATIRALAALGCLGIAVLMVLNGRGLMSWWPYVIMTFYAAAAIWGLTTVRSRPTLQRFAVEMAALVVVTLGLRAASPAMFSVETPQRRVPASVTGPRLPDTPLGRFVAETTDFLRAGETLLGAGEPMPRERWEALAAKLDYEALESLHGRMDTEAQARVYDVWSRLSELGPLLADLPERHGEEVGGGMALDPPEAELTALEAEVEETLGRAERLRSRIMVYGPEE
ncbi:MAG: hypothetical protein ACQEXJ_10990 [Myxococcota bacterium]